MDRRARANVAPGLVHLAEMLPALRLLIGLMIASIVILALYFGRDMLIPLALAMLFGFLLDPAVSKLKRWGCREWLRPLWSWLFLWQHSAAGHVSG
jgi:predicted PurR-regulated permease PerM